jgi:hypothetical protein
MRRPRQNAATQGTTARVVQIKPLVGDVTGTSFGDAKVRNLGLSSGSCCGPPCLKRLVSEQTERVAGGEMALDIEIVVDCGVSRDEALG